jgi:RHS repeat-associated protein
LGSTRKVTDATGSVIASYRYDAFGAVYTSTGSLSGDFLFAGEQSDKGTGLVYLRARYYDPSTGRFISKDPFGGFATIPASLNKYVYACNNPVNLTDPTGEVVPLVIAGVVITSEAIPWIIAALATATFALEFWIQQHQRDVQAAVDSFGTMCQSAFDGVGYWLQDLLKSKEFPANPDEWVPPAGVREETKASENTGGKIRHWVDQDNKLVREWHKGIPGDPGWGEKDHWHDKTSSTPKKHIVPQD